MKNIYLLIIGVLSLSVSLKSQQWTAITTPSTTGVEYLSVADNKLFFASSNGVFSSLNGTDWNNSSNGMTVTSGFTFSANIYNFSNVLYSGAMGAIYKSVDFGANWTKISGSAPSASTLNTCVYVKGDTIFSGWKNSGVYSTKNGTNWYQGTGSGIAGRSIDKDLVYHKGNIFVKTPSGVYKSTDKGLTFTLLSGGGLPAMSGNVGGLTVSNNVLICAVYLAGVYISTDEGATWIDKTPGGVTMKNFGTLQVIDGTVYMGCTGGKAFKSTDNGYTWHDISGTGLGNDAIKCFAVFKGELYAGGIAFLYKTSATSSVENHIQKPFGINVFPNPAENSIIIDNHGVKIGTINIRNIAGELIIENITIYENRQKLDISGLSKGIYFIESNNSGKVERHKFIKL